MLSIDGSRGGGQMLRLALGLSVVTQQPFTMTNIRGSRPAPGLKEQHLQGVRAIADLCGATVEGAEKESTTLTFAPGQIEKKVLHVRIRTAGSVGLLFQTLNLVPLALEEQLRVSVNGGATFGKWAPPVPYLQHVLLPLLQRLGYTAAIEVERHGFYPKGGARTTYAFTPWTPETAMFAPQSRVSSLALYSVASTHLKEAHVADRQARAARRRIANTFPGIPVTMHTTYIPAANPGSGIVCTATCDEIALGGDAVGEKGKRSEVVGEEAADRLLQALGQNSVDRHAADQLLPFLAFAGGSVRVPERTPHVQTTLQMLETFLPLSYRWNGNTLILDQVVL